MKSKVIRISPIDMIGINFDVLVKKLGEKNIRVSEYVNYSRGLLVSKPVILDMTDNIPTRANVQVNRETNIVTQFKGWF